ncbi:MAG: YihY/virulence factor BrkB family protein [Weeksellaceae bacterium]|nr:YihY/virulence factor BrkB family protein [Weeksellaceae bacterium]
MKINFKRIWDILKTTVQRWDAADPWRQSAIISYYAILSLPGLLIMVIWLAGRFFGERAVQGEVTDQFSEMLGKKQARYLENLVSNAYLDGNEMWYMQLIGIGVLIFGATTLFFQLQKTLNHIWRVQPRKGGVKRLIIDRANSMSLILVIAFLMLISLLISSILSAFSDAIAIYVGPNFELFFRFLHILLSFGIITVLFAMMYKVLPDVRIPWRAVWTGAIFTTLLFNAGKYALSYYFSVADPGNSFGAAGTIIIIMIWINYTTLILLFGAQFTQVFAEKMRMRFRPSKHAEWNDGYILQHKENLYPKVFTANAVKMNNLNEIIRGSIYINPQEENSAERLLRDNGLEELLEKPEKSALSRTILTGINAAMPLAIAYLQSRQSGKENKNASTSERSTRKRRWGIF